MRTVNRRYEPDGFSPSIGCVSHPANSKFVVIRDWQLAFTGGDACAAALLSFFEQRNDIPCLASSRQSQSSPYTEEQFERGVLIYSRRSIRPALAKLEALGAIETRKYPSAAGVHGRTRFFIFHPEVVQAFIASWDAERRDAEPRNL